MFYSLLNLLFFTFWIDMYISALYEQRHEFVYISTHVHLYVYIRMQIKPSGSDSLLLNVPWRLFTVWQMENYRSKKYVHVFVLSVKISNSFKVLVQARIGIMSPILYYLIKWNQGVVNVSRDLNKREILGGVSGDNSLSIYQPQWSTT